jgi:hypothetical protein
MLGISSIVVVVGVMDLPVTSSCDAPTPGISTVADVAWLSSG